MTNAVELANQSYLSSLRKRCEFLGLDRLTASMLTQEDALKFLNRMEELESMERIRGQYGDFQNSFLSVVMAFAVIVFITSAPCAFSKNTCKITINGYTYSNYENKK